ncbi:hypothetical protein CEXT_761691 [Caerostris extrusa]|uniref:Uncharacterized protein n=1 Tax=Caerostris extrusa TaxID=172846 RepID=A0AAV4UIV1_CAEEX|nr:hypothetical protein CEXT_761691 [Caerostris extrusa]
MSSSENTCDERYGFEGRGVGYADTRKGEPAQQTAQLYQKRRKINRSLSKFSTNTRLRIVRDQKLESCFLQTHSIRDRQIAFWKNSANKAKDEALEHCKALKKVAQEAMNVKTFSEAFEKGHANNKCPKKLASRLLPSRKYRPPTRLRKFRPAGRLCWCTPR